MSRVIHFEICASDPERAVAFYREALGWEIASPPGMEQYWLATTGQEGTPGFNGGIMGPHFPQAVINTIQVESLEDTLARVQNAGGKKVHGPNDIPGIGTVAYCADPEGTLFSILQPTEGT